MTIPFSERNSGPWTATAGQTVFNYDFPLLRAQDATVRRSRADVVTTLILDVHYVVTGVGNPAGGTIVLQPGHESEENDKVVVWGARLAERTANFPGFRSIPDNAIDTELDAMTVCIQEVLRVTGNALSINPFDDAFDGRGLRAANFADATESQDLVTYSQLQEAITAFGGGGGSGTPWPIFDVSGLDPIPSFETDQDTLLVWDESEEKPTRTSIDFLSDAGLTFLQTGAGAVRRPLRSKISEAVSVRDFGAVGDNVTNDSAAFQAAFDSGESVYVPPGKYFLGNTNLLVKDKAFMLWGAGLGSTELRWNGAGGGIRFEQNDGTKYMGIQNVSLLQSGAGVGVALYYDGSGQVSGGAIQKRNFTRLKVENVSIRGSTASPINVDGWFDNVVVESGPRCVFDNVYIHGKVGAGGFPDPDTRYGVRVFGATPTEIIFHACWFVAMEEAISVAQVEGVYVSDCTFLIPLVGIKFDSVIAGALAHVCTINNHFAVIEKAIHGIKLSNATIMGNLIYFRGEAPAPAVGVKLENISSHNIIAENIFADIGSPHADIAIEIGDGTTNCSNNFVTSNLVRVGIDTGVNILAGSTYTTVQANNFRSIPNPVVDAGTNTAQIMNTDQTIRSAPPQSILRHVNTRSELRQEDNGNNALFSWDLHPANATSIAQFRFFRNTNTNTHCIIDIHRGNGSADLNSRLSGNSNTYLNALLGSVGVGHVAPDRKFHVEENDAANSAVTYVQRLSHVTTGAPANGIGVGLEFEVETSADNNEIGATIEAVTTDVTATSEDFDLVFKLMAAGGAAAERARLKSTGQFDLAAGGVFRINAIQVVGARNTGWTAMTGAGSKGALAAAAAGAASAGYVQAEAQGALNRIAAIEARLKSYDDALVGHGLIGP